MRHRGFGVRLKAFGFQRVACMVWFVVALLLACSANEPCVALLAAVNVWYASRALCCCGWNIVID